MRALPPKWFEGRSTPGSGNRRDVLRRWRESCRSCVTWFGEVFVVDLETREVNAIRTRTGSSLVPDPDTRLSWIP
jgi:hypothetical protein